jgi:hypothetical protein
MKRLLVGCGLLGTLSMVLAAGASESVNAPGSACMSYVRNAGNDNIFSRSGGNGLLHNISSSAADVTCPISQDAYASSSMARVWQIDGQGTSGWDVGHCNLFSEAFGSGFAFPTANNTLSHPVSGYTQIRGSVSSAIGMGAPLVILCSIPAGGALVDYFTILD